MSQVRKYAKGGGTITKGGVTYEYTPELAQELSQFLSVNGAQDLYEIVDGFANGDNIKINPNGTIQGVSAWANDKNLDANVSSWRKNLDAMSNNRYHKIRSQLPILSGWIPSNKQTTETPTNLTDIFGNRDWFEYNTDENGKRTYLNNSSKNNLLMQRLDNMTEYLSDEEAGKKKYKLGQEYDTQRMAGLRQLFNTNKDKWGTTVDTLKTRIQSGEDLTPEEIAFLENFNIAKSDASASMDNATGKLSAADRTKWNNAGFGGLADLLGSKAHLNDDGTLSLNEGEDWGWNLGDLSGRNIWFNDDFYNTTYGASGEFDPYKNLTLYNGKLYSFNSPTLAKILNAEGGYNQLMKAGNFAAADNIILSRFTDAARENPAALGNDKYSTFLSENPTYRFSNLTGLYGINGNPLDNGDQLIQYIDLNEDSLSGPYRRYNYKYKILDSRGNARDIEVDPNTLTEIAGGQSAGDLLTYNRILGSENAAYNNRYYEDILDKNGEATGFRFYRNVKDPNGDVILHMPKINAVDAADKDLKLPKEIAQILMQNPTWLNKMIGNAQNKQNFIEIMSELVQSGWKQSDSNPLHGFNWSNITGQLRKLGFSQNEIGQFMNAWRTAKKGSRAQRREDMLVYNSFKQGGIISNQTGGKAGGSKSATGVSEKKVSVKNTNPQNAAGITEIGGNNWTKADTAEMAALVADLGSLGMAFVPGANVGALGAGIAGSTARYYADKQRGTEGAGLNYLLNLGMDATFAIPILGGITKTLRIPKLVAKALPTIAKAASVYGLGAGVVDTANKIASGEKFTVRDVDMIVNALTAGVGLSKSGGLGKSTKKGTKTAEGMELAGKKNNVVDLSGKKVTLSSDEVSAIAKLAPEKQEAAMNKLLVDKVKALSGNSALSDADALSAVDRSRFDAEVRNWKLGKGFGKKQLEFKLGETSVDGGRTPVEANGKWFHDWWHGVGGYNKMYNKTLRGENTGTITVKNTATRVYEPKTIKFNGKDVKFTPEEVEMIARRSGDIKGLMKSKLQGGDKKQWDQLYREFMHNRNKTKLNVNNDQIPEWYRARLSDQKWHQPGLGIGIGPVRSRTRTYDTRMAINMPQFINPFTAANQQANRDVQPSVPPVSYQPVFKKGGKIVKAQPGVNTSLLDMNILDSGFTNRMQQQTNKANNIAANFKLNKALNTGDTVKLNEIMSSAKNFKVQMPTEQSKVTLDSTGSGNVSVKPVSSGNGTYDFGNVLGGEAGQTPYFDPTMPMNWIGAGVANVFANKQLKHWLNRYKGNPRDVLLNAPAFRLSGAGDALRQNAKGQLYVKGNTSDWLQNESLRKAGQAAYNDAILKGNLQDAQEYMQYRADLDDFINSETKRHGEFANQVDNLRMQQSAADAQIKSNIEAIKSDIFNKAWYAQTQNANELAKQNAGISAQRDLQPKLQAIQTQYEQNLRAWQNKWGNNTDSGAAKAELQMIQANAMRQKQAYDMEYQNRALPSWARVKLAKGGKTGKDSKVTYSTTTSRDPYPELLIQNDKSTAQYVERLSEAVLKMILQTKPIHVS